MYVRISDTKVVAVGGQAHKDHLESLKPKAKQPKAKPKVTKVTKSKE